MKLAFLCLMMVFTLGMIACVDDGETSLVGPVTRGTSYTIEFQDGINNWTFDVGPKNGGRISGFSIDGTNMIANSNFSSTSGSTFWTSPQSDWGYPAPDAIDFTGYASAVDEATGTVTLTGKPETKKLNVQIVKEFSPDLQNKAMKLVYTIKNIGTEARSFAPWEVTRVPAEGLTFFPIGEGEITSGTFKSIPYTQGPRANWFTHSTTLSDADYKLFADGSDGWIAYTNGQYIFIKVFKDEPALAAAPGEAEIELYTKGSYVEVEQQGPYTEIPAGGELSWEVTWYLRTLPSDIDTGSGSMDLILFVESQI